MYMYDVDTDMHMMHIPIYACIYITYIYDAVTRIFNFEQIP